MIASRVLSSAVLLVAIFPAECKDKNLIERYLDLLQKNAEDAAVWDYPSDSREFFDSSDKEPSNWGSFDFIIVGAGAGGSVLTNRLTESGKFRVLLLEAGGQENDFSEVPGFAHLLINSDFNWGYKTVPQVNSCLGMKNKQCNYPRGRVLGGSTAINFMIYTRGNKEDFDKWGEENPGWDYESVLPYFKKSEKSTIENEDYEYHGHDGVLSVEQLRYYPNMTHLFLDAIQEIGEEIVDYNGKNQIGFSRIQSMTENGRRCSGNKAFIKPAVDRGNLQILSNSLAVKVLIKDKKAYGVEFVHNGRKYYATATKEVLLSAGTFNSAQLLMLSGVGPKEHLDELGIPVIQDLPVGKKYNDHQVLIAVLFATNVTVMEKNLKKDIENYLNGFGSLTSAAVITSIGFGNPRVIMNNPNIEYAFSATMADDTAPIFLDLMDMTKENWLAITKPVLGKVCWLQMPILLHPKSSGTVRLKSKDPLDFPLIDPNLFSDPEGDDLEEMLAAIKTTFKVSETPAFQSIGSKYLGNPLPGCTDLKHLSDDYWKCVLKQFTFPILHGVSSCKMGPETDEAAVVDSKLKVHGIGSLRVVDGSVIPFSLSSHPTAGIYMIGEKAADFIREDHEDV